MKKILKSTATVRFQHCDPYGVLYNARYLDYFMNAREDQVLEHYGIDLYKDIQKNGVAWVVGQNKISYFSPATLMEKVVITSKIINFSRKTLTIECVMYNHQESEIKSVLWVTFVAFDLKSKSSVELSEEWRKLFSEVKYPITQPDFDLRAKEILIETKSLQN